MADNRKPLGELADTAPRLEAVGLAAADAREQRRRTAAQYAGLFASATALFFAVDPIGIEFR